MCDVASSKKGFVKLLESKPDVVKYIHKLTYKMGEYYSFQRIIGNDDQGLSPILPNLLRTTFCLNCLIINGSKSYWNTLDSSLTSGLFYLKHLPTVNHIDLIYPRFLTF